VKTYPSLLRAAKIEMHGAFQPRKIDGLFSADDVEKMRQGGRDAGRPSGWDPARYEPIKVWNPDSNDATCPAALRDRFAEWFVIKGFHRLALARACGIESLDVIVCAGSFDEAVAASKRSNFETRALHPIDEAAVYRDRLEAGDTPEQISRDLDRRAPAYYRKRAAVAYLSPSLIADVRSGLLRLDYAEHVGRAAQVGASPAAQVAIASVAARTSMRAELFGRYVDKVIAAIAAAKPGEDVVDVAAREGKTLDLFPPTFDAGVAAVESITIGEARRESVRDGWASIGHAARAQLKRLETEGVPPPPALGRLIAMIDKQRAGEDRAVAASVGATDTREALPLIKWVGSKRTEAPTLAAIIRARLRPGAEYFEPFFGSGSVFFAVAPETAVIGDVLEPVVNLYKSTRDDPRAVFAAMRAIVEKGLDKASFLAARDADPPADRFERAGWFLYLNRTGFNGLWRTNKSGKLNAPFGTPKTVAAFPTLDRFERCAEILSGAVLYCGDYSKGVARAKAGDVVFADPPYPGTFSDYAKRTGPIDYAKLAADLRAAHDRGAHVVTTLAASEDLDALFSPWCYRVDLSRTSNVSCKASTRGEFKQVVWCSHEREGAAE